MAKAKRHTHKYQKMNVAYTMTWVCRKPDCNHYLPAHMKNTIEGKASICWTCDEEFVLDADALQMEKPICLKCRGITVEAEIPLTEELKKRLGIA